MDRQKADSIERLKHISAALDLILKFCQGKTEEEFISDPMLNSSVLYQFIIIGEAIRSIDPELLQKYPYPWHLPRSFRNYIAHEYFGINLRRVYATVKEILPGFKTLVDEITQKESDY